MIANKESNYLNTVLQWKDIRPTKTLHDEYMYKQANEISYNHITDNYKKECAN